MPDPEIDPDETYYPESEVTKTLQSLNAKIDKLTQDREDPEVLAERAKNRPATVRDLEEHSKKTAEELQKTQDDAKSKEQMLKQSTERYQGFLKEVKELTKANDQSWTPGREKTFKRVLNDVSREAREEVSKLRKEGDKTARVNWDAVDKEVKETLKDAFGWNVTDLEDEDGEKENLDNENDEKDSEKDSDDDDDKKEKSQTKKPLRIFSKGSGDDIDINNRGQMRQIMKEIEHMDEKEAITYRDKLMEKLSPVERKKLYNREIRNT